MKAKPLKIYTDLQYAPRSENGRSNTHVMIGAFSNPIAPPSIYIPYIEKKHELFELTESPADADLAVLPCIWNFYRVSALQSVDQTDLASRFVEVAKRHHLPVFIFHYSDDDAPIPLDAIIFRSSLYASKSYPKTMGLPSWVLNISEQMPTREKGEIPVVGFCGHAAPDMKRVLKHNVKQVARFFRGKAVYEEQNMLRARALRQLQQDASLKTNFLIRTRYYGGKAAFEENTNSEKTPVVVEEYQQNMQESDYILCIRGAGNYSIRLYETIRAGRIPLFVNTDCVLPYADEVDWKRYFVWVEKSDLAHIGQRVQEFHDRLSPADFIDLQNTLHQLWEDWLSPFGFFEHIHIALEKFA